MPVTFHLKRTPTVPLEAEVLTPDVIGGLSNAEIRALTVYHGKRQLPLGDFCDIEGEHSDELVLHGDMHKVRWVGRGMSRGSITIHGSIGMHLGAYMRGGRIDVHGDAGDWIGAEMRNGLIHIHGNAGGQVGKDGTFKFDKISPGKYTVSYTHYLPKDKDVSAPTTKTTKEVWDLTSSKTDLVLDIGVAGKK